MGELGANLSTGVNARGEDVSFIDVKIKIPDRNCDLGMWMTSFTGSARGGFWEFWRMSVCQFLRSEEEGWLSLACSGLVAGATRVAGADRKASTERLCLSPYVEKPFNSKVIKSFIPELRSRKCFSCFGIPVFYVYVMNILCTFHIFMYGYVTPRSC